MTTSKQSHGESSPTEQNALAQLHPTAFAAIVGINYQPGEMHWEIGKKLRELEAGEITRLLILAPPRHGKSELASVYLPAWFLGRNPDARVIAASYGAQLATTNGRRARDLVASPEFREVFPGIAIDDDASAADQWNIAEHDGGYLATSIGGAMTGFGADLMILDDVIKNREEAESPLQRDKLWDWLQSVALTRLQPGGRMVVVMTRWNRNDLAGRILEQGGWEVVQVPAISIDGEPAWPERYSLADLERIRLELDDQTWASLYQQEPVSSRGTVFESEWLPRVVTGYSPVFKPVARIISVDTALKDGEQNDYSAIVVAELMPNYRLHIRKVWRRRVKFPELVDTLRTVIEEANHDGKLWTIVIEDAASGSSVYQTLSASMPRYAHLLEPWTPLGSKVERARLVSPLVRNGAVVLPPPGDDVPWLADFEKELFEFPGSMHDDQVDAFVHLLHYMEFYLVEGIHARAGYDQAMRGDVA